ncbi:GAF domain-containing protein [Prauserella rugosa]|uniref:GAF domain-containing protein n=1 Tax=Prauserella rugosa TaxID=43354 RepID=A0A660CEH8_9PSEU|nr:GAF domain-containing protein [Prauserella rugosa]TWH21736.1 GAF domain-containing protein [Prauserella rugosa]
MTGEAALPGLSGFPADLSEHARVMQRVHEAVLSGARPPVRPRDVVERSWSRMLDMGLDTSGVQRTVVSLPEVELRRRRSGLEPVIDDLRRMLRHAAETSPFLVVVTDADGVILWRDGSARVRAYADALGFTEGARWTEATVGTNAVGTALVEAAPVQLLAAEHFEPAQHRWYCCAAPVHSPVTGELAGVVDISGPALTLHPAIGALVETSVRLAESGLWRLHEQRLERLRRSAEPVLGGTAEPLLVVDDDGWVAVRSGIAVGARVPVPREGLPMAVAGLGLCTPERLGEGWLLRPERDRTPMVAELDLTGDPVVRVHGGDGSWSAALTRRQGQVLALIADAGPGGLDAAALGRALFGDDGHVVTARAEVSRLRRVVGDLVAPAPYRLSDGVTLTVTRPR